jgi:oligoribonuclease NrnB/cAMP/cGMP phosphodiesterase (DHH superfamily)
VNKKLCIYHGNCADGFTAAWVVRLAEGEDNVEFHPGFYKDAPPDTTGRIVYIVDFSYKRPVMEEIVAKARKVIHIDHHDTAIKAMAGYTHEKFETKYSPANTASGAMLTWQYFFPHSEVPMFIKHIDDRDRWKFDILGTREVQANIFSYDYTFENWDMLVKQRIEDQIREGSAIERRVAKDIRELMNVVVRRINICGYNVPVANIPYQFGSDMCDILSRHEPFAAYYYDTPSGRQFGLRSALDGVDVGEIAANFGGGGHAHASGFIVSYETARGFEA